LTEFGTNLTLSVGGGCGDNFSNMLLEALFKMIEKA
jgi:hypothetical protein